MRLPYLKIAISFLLFNVSACGLKGPETMSYVINSNSEARIQPAIKETQIVEPVVEEVAELPTPEKSIPTIIKKRMVKSPIKYGIIKKSIMIPEPSIEIAEEITVDDLQMIESSIQKEEEQKIVSLDNLNIKPEFELESAVVALDTNALLAQVSFPKESDVVAVKEDAEAAQDKMINEAIESTEVVAPVQIDTVAAAQPEPLKVEEKVKVENKNDEIIAFDYSSDEAEKTEAEQDVAPSSLSTNVLGTLERIYKESDTSKSKHIDTIVQSSESKQSAPARTSDYSKAGFVAEPGKVTLVPVVAHLEKGIDSNEHQFEYSYLYDENEREMANQEGKILISQKGMVTGKVTNYRGIPTNVEIPNDGEMHYVPILNYDGIAEYVEKNQIEAIGGYVLIELSDSFDDIEVDEKYTKKVFLSEKFKTVNSIEDARFVLFIAVAPGNVTIKYKIGSRSLSTIRLVLEDEITYDSREVTSNKTELLTVNYRLPMGTKPVEMDIEDMRFEAFMTPTQLSRIGTNGIKATSEFKLRNTKSYFQIFSQGFNYFVSPENKKQIEIPTTELNKIVFGRIGLGTLENSCMVTVETNGKIQDFKASLATATGTQGLNIYSLSENGQINYEIDETTQKIILVGQDQGEIHYSMTDMNGKKTNQKTYCSLGTYILE